MMYEDLMRECKRRAYGPCASADEVHEFFGEKCLAEVASIWELFEQLNFIKRIALGEFD